MTNEIVRPERWTRLSILLHWLIVALILVQFLDHESMVALWDGTLEHKPIAPLDVSFGWVHIASGTIILAAAALRLVDRIRNGRPPHPVGQARWAGLLATVTHGLIYAILIAMPALGLAAWISGIDAIAGFHTLLWTPLLVLISVHVAGALVQHFHFRTNVLRRMVGILPRP